MKKVLIALLLLVCFSLTAEAKIYVVFDKATGEIQGTAYITDELLLNWTEDSILKEADNSYRGKRDYEIVYENGELRHATQAEIDSYLDSIKPPTEKEKFLKMLDDIDIVNKIKDKVK